MKCASVLSTEVSKEFALHDAIDRFEQGLGGDPADFVTAFVSPHHAGLLGQLSRLCRERGLARHFVGCTAESVVGEDREVEQSPAISLWGISGSGASITPLKCTEDFAATVDQLAVGSVDERIVVLLGDPFSFPTDSFLSTINSRIKGLRIVGGMASGGQKPNENRLVLDDAEYHQGAIGLAIEGPVRTRTVVSQGCRPIGKPLLVTKVERNLIRELGRRPALQVLQQIFEELDFEDKDRARQGLHIGRVINEYQDVFQRGDFLIRNVLGADESGALAISDVMRVGQTVQFQVRDAETADEDLRDLLDPASRTDRPQPSAAGVLLFTCNGRGTRLFDAPNHDIGVFHEILGPVPIAGFFAMGEVGPIGGQNFVHGFTASALVFENDAQD